VRTCFDASSGAFDFDLAMTSPFRFPATLSAIGAIAKRATFGDIDPSILLVARGRLL